MYWKARSIAFSIRRRSGRRNTFHRLTLTAPRPPRAKISDRSDREPVLNPFSVYEKNPDLLAQELTALRGWHLKQIIRDFDLVDEREVSSMR